MMKSEVSLFFCQASQLDMFGGNFSILLINIEQFSPHTKRQQWSDLKSEAASTVGQSGLSNITEESTLRFMQT